MIYNVMVSVSISPQEVNYSGNRLFFSKTFNLEGESYGDIAEKVDYIYDLVEVRANAASNDRHDT